MQSVQLYWCLLVHTEKTISIHSMKYIKQGQKSSFMSYSIFGIIVLHAADVLQLSSLAIHIDCF
jgi:hypothetical protein